MEKVASPQVFGSEIAESPCADSEDLSHSDWVESIFDANHEKLINYAASLLSGNRDAAIDAVQETFLRLCRQQRSSIESYVQPWLYRTCRNYIFDQLRQSNRMSTSLTPAVIADERQDTDPSARMTHDDEMQRCCEAIAKLPNSQQEVLQLRMTHGMSYKQISEVTGMTVTHVGVTLHQAIQRLRTALAT